jgi:hypothetical protein
MMVDTGSLHPVAWLIILGKLTGAVTNVTELGLE